MVDINIKKTCMRVLISALLVVFAACSGSKFYELNLMPAPEVYDEDTINPFTDLTPIEKVPYTGILYATDREPAGKNNKDHFYTNDRGHVLRLGLGHLSIGENTLSWEEARQISLLKNRAGKYPLKITGVEEFGTLDKSDNIIFDPERLSEDPLQPGIDFSSLINKKLSISKNKDIYIYVHGYKVVFVNPLLVASELWHFLGYDGVFIAYAWPSTPSKWAYASDIETATYSSRHLRLLIEYLADKTEVERIHIVGYSAGTRVVINALARLALARVSSDNILCRRPLPVGHVILVGSDFDSDIFSGYINDGLLGLVQSLNVYVSEKDKALGFSKWFFRQQRLGQVIVGQEVRPWVMDFLRETDNLNIIDVTKAEKATSGNGHAYFRKSPWVSSDILMTLMYGLSPKERGLVSWEGLPIWMFPDDYIKQLRAKLVEVLPGYSTEEDEKF